MIIRTFSNRVFKHTLATLAICIGMGLNTSAQGNGLQQQLNGLFDSMTNVTQPGVYETQRRGVLAGGRFTMKNRIYQENIFHITPPSVKAGCGGIDFFGGSFSFINSEQLIQLLRSIAANAAGYAFHLALSTACEACMAHIETLAKKIQSLNQHMGNSCQMAQGLINDLTAGIDLKGKTEASLFSKEKGLFSDFFSAFKPADKAPITEIQKYNPDALKKFVGNVVWKELQRNGTQYWFSYGDRGLLEAMMSITGTVIVHEPRDSDDSPGEGGSSAVQDVTTLAGHKVKLIHLIEGGDIEVYSCQSDTELCMDAGKGGSGLRSISIIGFTKQIQDVLAGPLNDAGIIGKFASNSGDLTPTEKAFMGALPEGLGTLIRNLSVLHEDSARTFVFQASNTIATAMAHHLVMELYRASRSALVTTNNPNLARVQEEFSASYSAIRAEYTELLSRFGNISEHMGHYNTFLTNIRKQRYMLTNHVNSEK